MPPTFVWDEGFPVSVYCFDAPTGDAGEVGERSLPSRPTDVPPELDQKPQVTTPDPALYMRLPGEDLQTFERRLRTLAAQDLLPSGPGGQFILQALERERAIEAKGTEPSR